MLLQIFKVEKNYFSIKGLKTKGLKNLAGEESVKESNWFFALTSFELKYMIIY